MRPSLEMAGLVAAAFGWPPEGVWASSAFGCSASAGEAALTASTTAAGSGRRMRRRWIIDAQCIRRARAVAFSARASAALPRADVAHVEGARRAGVGGVVPVRAARDLGGVADRAAGELLVHVGVDHLARDEE